MPNSVVKLGVVVGSNPARIAGAGYSGAVTYEYFKKVVNLLIHKQKKVI